MMKENVKTSFVGFFEMWSFTKAHSNLREYLCEKRKISENFISHQNLPMYLKKFIREARMGQLL